MSDNGELEGTPLRPEGSPPDFRIAVNGSEVVVSEALWLQHVLRMPKATRRALYQAAYGIFTCPDALKKHAATLGKHVGDKPGAKKKAVRDGDRYLGLRAKGYSDREIANMESSSRARIRRRDRG